MKKELPDICKYYFDCVASRIIDRDCIFGDCRVKRFYNRYGIDYLDSINHEQIDRSKRNDFGDIKNG